MKGTLKWFNEKKNFGFVVGDDNKDYFVHRSDMQEACWPLEDGMTLFFDPEENDRGLCARDVSRDD